MDPGATLPWLLGAAWLLPLASFALIVLFGPTLGKGGKYAAYAATSAIVTACVLSIFSLLAIWLPNHPVVDAHAAHEAHHDSAHPHGDQHPHGEDHEHGSDHPHDKDAQHEESAAGDVQATTDATFSVVTVAHLHPALGEQDDHVHGQKQPGEEAAAGGEQDEQAPAPAAYSGTWYALGIFGDLRIEIGYYIDSLTVAMFCMVTLIASCIHFYAMGYMHEELHAMTDHQVTLSDGEHLHRPGRYHRFFQYLSLFCFSMLGLVYAGNIAMVFVFWELVGICSYFLIGFYIERKSASTAANKAFIVNRVGDFGMIIGLMALFGALGTFSFGDYRDDQGALRPGIFSQVRPAENDHRLQTPDGMVVAAAGPDVARAIARADGGEHPSAEVEQLIDQRRSEGVGYGLLVIAGLGIFCGCVGKSAQFPLHVWLPDAMEGPTPVSALVHSATMVAAGVYLVGRFYPVFAPEVLLVIAYIGAITLFLAATIAITATDIKRVLAYSTVSQLGYMMLGLGVGGWVAGMFHLFTHAFFKSLLFMCSGSVIHAVHTNEMTEMGGLWKKMPWTAYTMLVGCLAIIGAAVPFVIGLSGYYSKDAIIEQAMSFSNYNPAHRPLFFVSVAGAAITAFYMFRMWYMTFAGQPRDPHRYDHAHESPKVMYYPLVLLAVFAVGVGWTFPLTDLSLTNLLEQSRPAGTLSTSEGVAMLMPSLVYPSEPLSHLDAVKYPAGTAAFVMALSGFLLATAIYARHLLNPAEIRQQFRPVHRFLINKWWFDELYDMTFVAGTHALARVTAWWDRNVLDTIVHTLARVTRWLARFQDRWFDRAAIDGTVNAFARRTWNIAMSLHGVQTGRLRQYVMFIVVGTIALFMLISFVTGGSAAGG